MKTSKKLSLGFVFLYCLAMLSGCCTLFPKASWCPPKMAIFPTSLDFGNDTNSLILSIKNDGGGTLEWSAIPDKPWITLSQSNGTANSSETDQVEVTVDRSAVASGTYNGNVRVNTNAGDLSVEILMVKEDIVNPNRRVTISGAIQLRDDEILGDEYASDSFTKIVFVNDTQPQLLVKVPPPKPCAGKEVMVALDILVIRINEAGDIRIDINGRLYEGTESSNCNDYDLDGTYNTTFTVPPNTTKEKSFTIWNTEENVPDDKADITLTVYNGPAS